MFVLVSVSSVIFLPILRLCIGKCIVTNITECNKIHGTV